MMTPADVTAVLDTLDSAGVEIWVDGGWCIDALLSEQTRDHDDLDVAVQHADVPKLREALAERGFTEVPRRDTTEWNFVLSDECGHAVDVHSFQVDSRGDVIYGIKYPRGSLTGTGSIAGRLVNCISPEWMVEFHSRYDLRDKEKLDMRRLCDRFGLPLP
jgi:lincosamide nucleotidyltransferase A/C/D/E